MKERTETRIGAIGKWTALSLLMNLSTLRVPTKRKMKWSDGWDNHPRFVVFSLPSDSILFVVVRGSVEVADFTAAKKRHRPTRTVNRVEFSTLL
jgi:hypothetical protein